MAGIVLDITHIIAQLEIVERFISEIEAEMVVTLGRYPLQRTVSVDKGTRAWSPWRASSAR